MSKCYQMLIFFRMETTDQLLAGHMLRREDVHLSLLAKNPGVVVACMAQCFKRFERHSSDGDRAAVGDLVDSFGAIRLHSPEIRIEGRSEDPVRARIQSLRVGEVFRASRVCVDMASFACQQAAGSRMIEVDVRHEQAVELLDCH